MIWATTKWKNLSMTKTPTTSLAEFKAKALSKKATKAAYDALGPEFEAAVLVIQARAGWSVASRTSPRPWAPAKVQLRG
jgi:hypothetical protein